MVKYDRLEGPLRQWRLLSVCEYKTTHIISELPHSTVKYDYGLQRGMFLLSVIL